MSSPTHRYVLMAEPDHIFIRPMPNFMIGDKPAAYNFGLDPAREETCPLIKRWGVVQEGARDPLRSLRSPTISSHKCEWCRMAGLPNTPSCGEVMPIGNSPTFLSWTDMEKVRSGVEQHQGQRTCSSFLF